MSTTKIVMIGAGSLFGPRLLGDAMQLPQLYGSEIALVDVSCDALRRISDFARLLNDRCGTPYRLTAFTDRTEALPQADFVITTCAVGREDRWQKDWEIPRRHGVRQVLGENGGPGGLSHTLRNVPMLLDICRDVEQLCPEALLINFTNPESRLCMAVHRHTKVRAVGLCHGFAMIRRSVGEVLDCAPESVETEAGGLNHFTWIYRMWDRTTGDDLYPRLRSAYAAGRTGSIPLSLFLMDSLGLLPSPSDDHVGEYLSYAWEFNGLEGFDFARWARRRQEISSRFAAIIKGTEKPDDFLTKRSGEVALDIIAGVAADVSASLPAVNVPNHGAIPNLPDDAIVEVPATVDRSGLQPVQLPPLPEPVAAMCRQQISIQRLSVEAAVAGSRELALQALLLDPVIASVRTAETVLDELLEAHREYLPQFQV